MRWRRRGAQPADGNTAIGCIISFGLTTGAALYAAGTATRLLLILLFVGWALLPLCLARSPFRLLPLPLFVSTISLTFLFTFIFVFVLVTPLCYYASSTINVPQAAGAGRRPRSPF